MKISIPQPCTKNFENFVKTDNGGFCKNCQTEVIDFTKMSQPEIRNYFIAINGKVCGRMLKQQLDLKPMQTSKMKNGLLAASFSLFALFFSKPSNAQQGENKSIEQLIEIGPKKFGVDKKQIDKTTPIKNDTLPKITEGIIEITGTVFDADDKEPLIGANVWQIDTENGIATDIDGNFKMKLNATEITDSIILEINYIGFESTQLVIFPSKKNINLEIALKSNDILLGEVYVIGSVYYKKFSIKRIWYRTKSFFKRIF